jgi:hypothetical protein
MRWLGALLIILATTLSMRAEDWTTADGKTYRNITIIGQEDDGVRVTYTGGVGKIPYYELSDDVLRRLGQDPVALAQKRAAALKAQADAAKAQADADAALKAQQDAAEQKKEQDEAAAAAASQQQNQPQPQNQSQSPGQPSSPNQSQQANAPAAPKPAPVAPVTPPPPPEPPVNSTANAAAAGTGTSADNSSGTSDEQQSSYPNSKFQYDETTDVSYLDSPVIEIVPISLDVSSAAASAPAQNASLYLRIITEGHRAEAPDQVEGVFFSTAPLKNLSSDHVVKFLVDGAFITGTPPIEPTDGTAAAPADSQQANQVTFFLTPEQMKTVLRGKKVNFSVGGYNYMIDDTGIATFRGFLADVNHLPPASANLIRVYHRFLNRLPSIITMISTTCEYIILGAFAIVVVASIAAFVMGLTRFIKM